jgi:putative FmdB family regulatory protein
MSLYDYSCHCCGFLWENVNQSIHDKPKKQCPRCNKMSLSRLISLGLPPIVKGDATTLGQLADRNTKKIGKYKISENKEKYEETISRGSQERKDLNKKISKMTPEQKSRYIENG